MTTTYEEPVRCECDHSDGGVCQRVLWRDGTCPGEAAHMPGAPCPCGEPSFVTTRDGTVGGTRWCLTCARRRWHERDYWRDDER